MSELKLRNWGNKDKMGTRFPSSHQLCPKCNQPTLEDRWPPDYGGGCGTICPNGRFEVYGSQKFLCVPCQITFRVSWCEKTTYADNGAKKKERKVIISESVSLVEKDGYLLTPYDIWRENYRDEHGEYPCEIYA